MKEMLLSVSLFEIPFYKKYIATNSPNLISLSLSFSLSLSSLSDRFGLLLLLFVNLDQRPVMDTMPMVEIDGLALFGHDGWLDEELGGVGEGGVDDDEHLEVVRHGHEGEVVSPALVLGVVLDEGGPGGERVRVEEVGERELRGHRGGRRASRVGGQPCDGLLSDVLVALLVLEELVGHGAELAVAVALHVSGLEAQHLQPARERALLAGSLLLEMPRQRGHLL